MLTRLSVAQRLAPGPLPLADVEPQVPGPWSHGLRSTQSKSEHATRLQPAQSEGMGEAGEAASPSMAGALPPTL